MYNAVQWSTCNITKSVLYVSVDLKDVLWN